MKTTIEISTPLIEEVRRVVSRDGATLRELVEQGLRHVIAERKTAVPFKLKKAAFGGKGLQAGVGDGSWERIREIVYEGHGG